MRRASVLFILCFWLAAADWYSVLYNNGQWKVAAGRRRTALAWGLYSVRQGIEGWNELTIETNSIYPDDLQASGAGFIEVYPSGLHINTSGLALP